MTQKKTTTKSVLKHPQGVMHDGQGGVNRKPLFISFVVLVVVVLAVALLFFAKGKTFAGKAYNVESTVDYSKIVDTKAVYLQNAKGYAQQGDPVSVPFYVKNVIGQGELGLSQATICLDYDVTKFQLTGAKITKAGWTWLLTDAEILTALSSQGKGVDKCAGYSLKVDVGKSSTGTVISTLNAGDQLGVFEFTVLSDYAGEIEQKISLKTIYLSGLKDVGNWWADVNLNYDSALLIAHKCPDADGDGYPSITLAQAENGVVGKDLRACPYKSPIDCNDNDKQMYPGFAEVCDGNDNNCDGQVDEKLSASANSVTKGVCFGNKVCQKGGWVDSYLVDDPTIMFNGVKQFGLYTAGKDACDFYDNDCDGLVNEDDPNCKIGGGVSPGLLPTGNTFLTYDAANKLSTQVTNPVDVSLLYVLNDARTDAESGGVGQLPYQAKVKGNLAWVCDSGLYYVEYKAAAPAGVNTYEKHFYDGDKVVLAGVTKNVKGNIVADAVEIKC